MPTLTVNSNSAISVECQDVSSGSNVAYLQGNLVLNGVGLNIQQETIYSEENYPLGLGYVDLSDDASLSVSGSITILSETPVVYYSISGDTDEDGNWTVAYGNPSADVPLFICSSINQDKLNLLTPYAFKEMYNYETGEESYGVKPLTEREYYAKAGEDGKVYVYLGDDDAGTGGEGGEIITPPTPNEDTVVLNDLVLGEYDGGYYISDKNLELTSDWSPAYVEEYGKYAAVTWEGTDAAVSYTMEGSGKLGDGVHEVELDIVGPGQFSIGENIKLTQAEVTFSGNSGSSLEIKGTLDDCYLGALSGTVDISKATLTGEIALGIGSSAVLTADSFTVTQGRCIEVWDNDDSAIATLDGNLVFNGSLPSFATEQTYAYNGDDVLTSLMPHGYVQFTLPIRSESYAPLNVTGSITIQSASAVVFATVGEYVPEGATDGKEYYRSDYVLPAEDAAVFICSAVDETSLSMLKPYAYRENTWVQLSDAESSTHGGNYYLKPVDDREFYAKAGGDGKVHICLGEVDPGTGGEEPGGGEGGEIITPPTPSEDTVVLNDLTLGEYDGGYYISDKNLKLTSDWSPAYVEEYGECAAITWNGIDTAVSYTMEGSGKLGDGVHEVVLCIFGSGQFSIGEDIEISYAQINQLICSDSKLEIKGKLDNCLLSVQAGTLDITQATLSGNTSYDISCGAILKVGSVSVQPGSYVLVMSDCESGGDCGHHYATIDGNLILNGGVPGYTTEQKLEYADEEWEDHLRPYGFVQFWTSGEEDVLAPLHVTGTITIQSSSVILFANEGVHSESGDKHMYVSDYRLPGVDDVLFVCSGVNEESLSMLKPYAYREDSWEQYNDEDVILGGYEYFKPVDDREFFAKSGADGKTYIYLGEAGSGGGEVNQPIVVAPGSNVTLGGEDGPVPSVEKPVIIQGGVADASALNSTLLTNQIITGTGGTVLTSDTQKMVLSGSGSLNYGIEGVTATDAGAALEFNVDGNMNLRGDKYATKKADITAGVVTVSSAATLGMDSTTEVTEVMVQKDASLTNFGKVVGVVKLASGATMLNQNMVEGDVQLTSGSTFTNNADVTGSITVESGSLLSGSGAASALVLKSGARLNVGNSPGYQRYTSLTLSRGTQLTFTVDGTTAATDANYGAGTYSVLETGTLTMSGTGTVTVNVDVTMGIVAAGSEPFTLTLLSASVTSDATQADFTLNLNDEAGLLEAGTTLAYDDVTRSLKLRGSVSKAALAVLMDRNSANMANTMWASANAVHEFARTAESQFLVGMPGQTTFWGAGIGSFMNISGDQGFTSNAGGYAVGMQHAVNESFRVGFAMGQMFGDFQSDDKQLKVDQEVLMPALTAQYVVPTGKSSSLCINGHVAYGEVENEADTYQTGTIGTAEWEDEVLNVGVRATWNTQLTENTTMSFFTGLTYQRVEQEAFTEKYTGGVREYRDGSMSSLSVPLGVTLTGIYEMGGTNIFVPEITLAYIGDIARDNPEVKSTVHGFNRKAEGTDIGRSAVMVSAGANWMFDSSWSVGVFYNLEARKNQVNQSVNASLRCSF